MSPRKGQCPRPATRPSPKKTVSKAKKRRYANDGSTTSESSNALEESLRLRESLAPSPSSVSTNDHSSMPQSPTKRRILSGTLPPSPKKKKSVFEGTAITDDMADLRMQEDSQGSQIGLPLKDDAVSIVEHIENVSNVPKSPDTRDVLEIDEKTISQTHFEVFESLEKYAEDNVSFQAEKLFSQMSNEKIASERAEIAQLKKEVRHMNQAYNEEIARLTNLAEHNAKKSEENIASGRAKMSQIQEGFELLKTKPSLSLIGVLDEEWEMDMLERRTRNVIRVGRDGTDEFFKAPFSENCYVDVVREILRRSCLEDGSVHGCYPSDSSSKPEMASDFNLLFLSSISKQPNPEDYEVFEAAVWFISRYLLTDREETYRCLAAHPFYQQMKEIQTKIKQVLILFFDRRFTWQMGQFYGLNIRLDDILLRLGGDSTFCEEGFEEGAIADNNKEAWAYIIGQNHSIEQPSTKKCGTPPTPDEQLDELEFGEVHAKRSKRITDSEVDQYKIISKQALADERSVKRSDQVTKSEVMEYAILTKQAFGRDALEIKSTVAQPLEPISEGLSEITEEDAGKVVRGGDMMEDVSLD